MVASSGSSSISNFYTSHGTGSRAYPTGCGKTSLVCQAAARLHWPVQMVPVHGRLELDDMLGQKVLDNGSTPFLYGALSIAVREGHILILDEMDIADPSELAGLYDLLDGAPLVLAQNGGEIIPVHPRFRFVATGNSAGSGAAIPAEY